MVCDCLASTEINLAKGDSFLNLICYTESLKIETFQSQQSLPKKFGGNENLYEGVTCTVYTREKRKEEKINQGKKHKFSDKYQQTVALQLDNEKSPEEHSNTYYWALFHLQNRGAQSPF